MDNRSKGCELAAVVDGKCLTLKNSLESTIYAGASLGDAFMNISSFDQGVESAVDQTLQSYACQTRATHESITSANGASHTVVE